jgi:type VI protein secretion system component VasK
LQDQQGQWQTTLQDLRSSDSQLAAADLQQQLEQLLEQLLSLPDPLPALSNAAALAARTKGEAVAVAAAVAQCSGWHKQNRSPPCSIQVAVLLYFTACPTSNCT